MAPKEKDGARFVLLQGPVNLRQRAWLEQFSPACWLVGRVSYLSKESGKEGG